MMTEQGELVFLPLGGSGEIGMNFNLYGLGPASARQWLLIDCGVTFGDDRVPGIDVITPDPSFLLDEIAGDASLLGLVITHGHEDHVGAVAHLWPLLKCPIYTTAFTAEIASRKFAEAGIIDPPITIIKMHGTLTLGDFDLQFVTLTHSIPEPNGIILGTPFGSVLHTGDWKIDPDPSLGPVTESPTLEALGHKGVLAMICDSTNVMSAGESGSEMAVRRSLTDLIADRKGRIAVTTFASNVGRLVSICEAAYEAHRSVCLLGRSMLRMVDIARATDILPAGISFVEPADAGFMPPENILYLCTGSQGEDRAALSKIARDEHRDITLNEGDTVIFSSKIIPGNERGIFDLQNLLTDMGIEIITEKDHFVHVSGHPCQDELAQMYRWVKPKISVPVHGEARHLEAHCDFARAQGVERAISVRNGDMVRLAPGKPEIIDEVPAGRLLLDGHLLIREGDGVIRARRRLAYDGAINVTVVLSEVGEVLAAPEIALFGIPSSTQSGEEFQHLIEDAVEEAVDALPRPKRRSDAEIEKYMRKAVRSVLLPQWGKRSDIKVTTIRV